MSGLHCPQLVFIRGNHEQEEWPKFVEAWPLNERPLVALDGTAHVFGPLVMVGFPCHTGWEDPWRQTLPRAGNEITLDVALSGRKVLPADHGFWLPPLIRRLGPAGRALWLMHEPPQVREIARAYGELRDWHDNLPEGINSSDKAAEIDEAASTLENINFPEVPDGLCDGKVLHLPSLEQNSRPKRGAEVISMREDAIDGLNSKLEDPRQAMDDAKKPEGDASPGEDETGPQEKIAEIESLVSALEDVKGELENVTYPSMM